MIKFIKDRLFIALLLLIGAAAIGHFLTAQPVGAISGAYGVKAVLSSTEKLGALSIEGGNVYKYVYNQGTVVLKAGDVVYYYLGGGKTYEVTVCATANLDKMAGVVVIDRFGATTVATHEYGWIQTYGNNDNVLTYGDGSSAIGDNLVGATTTYSVTRESATGTAATYINRIEALEAYTTYSAAKKKAFIRCFN